MDSIRFEGTSQLVIKKVGTVPSGLAAKLEKVRGVAGDRFTPAKRALDEQLKAASPEELAGAQNTWTLWFQQTQVDSFTGNTMHKLS